MGEYRDLQILGVGRERGGRFGKVLIAGSGKLTGAVECEEFSVPGAGKVEDGGLTVHGPISCHGACKVEGSVSAQSLSVFGAFSTEADCLVQGDAEINGSLKTEGCCTVEGQVRVTGSVKSEGEFRCSGLKISGVLKCEAPLRAEEITVTGALKTESDVQAERFHAEGPVTIDGELNADSVELELIGESAIESIVGGSVRIRCAAEGEAGQNRGIHLHLNLNLPFLGSRRVDYDKVMRPHLAANLIEADEIELEFTDSETVRGGNIRIGPECVIDRVEYSRSLYVDPNASVREKVHI